MNKNSLFEYFKIFVSLVMIILSVIIFFTTYQERKARSETLCDVGSFFKDEGAPYEYKGNTVVTSVGIKAGTDCTFFKVNGSAGCYEVQGLGTNNVNIKQIKNDSSCKSISHVSFFSTPVTTPSPTPRSPTLTPTVTPTTIISVTVSPTLTKTPTKSPTPTPTANPTQTPTRTPTLTRSPTDQPTSTPTGTLVPTETPNPSATPSPTETPNPTGTPTGNPTATSTSSPGNSPTPTEIVIAQSSETPEESTPQPETTGLPTVGTITGWIILAVPIIFVALAFIF